MIDPETRQTLFRVASSVGVGVFLYYAFLFFMQRGVMYPAPRGPWNGTAPDGARRVALTSATGPVEAWFLPPLAASEGAVPAVVYTHGNAERAEWTLHEFETLRRAGMAIVVPEYPGYGSAPGSPSEESITAAVLAAYDWLVVQPGIDPARIVAHGRSIGGGAATRLAARRPVAAIVLESAFTSARVFARRFLAPGFLVRDPFDNLAALRGCRGPLLVIHGRHDTIAPFEHGERLAAAVPGARLVPLECDHNDCPRAWGEVLEFLAGAGVVRAAA
ncbi:MAG TPA: alpha/beta hydrolase [Candidatus Polarisedimenticolaceae bacterium]